MELIVKYTQDLRLSFFDTMSFSFFLYVQHPEPTFDCYMYFSFKFFTFYLVSYYIYNTLNFQYSDSTFNCLKVIYSHSLLWYLSEQCTSLGSVQVMSHGVLIAYHLCTHRLFQIAPFIISIKNSDIYKLKIVNTINQTMLLKPVE